MKIYTLLKTGLLVTSLLSTIAHARDSKECQSALKKTEDLYSKAVNSKKLETKQARFNDAIYSAENGSYSCSDKNMADKKIIDRLLLITELSYMGKKGKSIPDTEDIDTYQDMRKAARAKKIAKVKASHGNKTLSETEKQKRIQQLKLNSTCGISFFIMKSSYDMLLHMKSTPSLEITQLLQETRHNCDKNLDNELILLDITVGEKLPELVWKKTMNKKKNVSGGVLSDKETKYMAKQLCKNVSKSSVGYRCKCSNTKNINIRTFGKVGGNFGLLTKDVMIGYFDDGQKIEAILPTEGCEPHMYNNGGYAVYSKDTTGNWLLNKYYSGKLGECKNVSLANNKNRLVCNSHFFAQGYDENRLYIAKLTNDGIKQIDILYTGSSNGGTLQDKQYDTTIRKWSIENDNVIFTADGKTQTISLSKYGK